MLTGHDVGALFRALNEAGVPQRRIAVLTGTTQPQVADIITGRWARVQVYEVLVRIAERLSIPRERMGLSFWGPDGFWYGSDDTYPEVVTVAHAPKAVSADMLRRHLIALGGITMVGAPVAKVGELLAELGDPPPVPPPSQLSHVHVMQVRDLTRRLAEAGNSCICDPQVLSDAAARATRLLDAAIRAFIDGWNDRCHPFTWTKTPTRSSNTPHPRNVKKLHSRDTRRLP